MQTALKYFFVFSFLLSGFYGFPQIFVTNAPPYNTANSLVQNVLLGQGVTATNIALTKGQTAQMGFFNGQNSNIGIDSGIVLSSGNINVALGPNNSGSFTLPSGGYNGPGDPDLFAISGNQSYDAAVLEFDFIPIGDTVVFNYVFGSEEYNEYVCASVNDAFGFFLSGPGISGPYTLNAKNIALIPGTNVGVSINSVNNGTVGTYGSSGNCISLAYSAYFNTNNSNSVQFDGFTKVLQAMSPVQCGLTYHLKIAISDAGDAIYDSGVFLEGGSFGSTPSIAISSIPPNIIGGISGGSDTALFEECGPVVLTLVRSGNSTQQAVFQITTSGSATSGTDYSIFPDSITFLPGQDTLSISFMPFQDFVLDGIEDLVVEFNGYFCSTVSTNSISLTIDDTPPLTITSLDDTINCLVSSVSIGIQATGLAPLSYQWSTGALDTNGIVVSPAVTTDYYVTVTDACNVNSEVDTVTVYVINDPITLSTSDDTVSCISSSATLNVQVLTGISPFFYQWDNGATTDTSTVMPTATTDYFVTVTDACGLETEVAQVTVVVLSEEVQLFVSGDTSTCPGDEVQIEANPTGGYPPYTYLWDTIGGFDNDSILIVYPLGDVTYTVFVTDQCGSNAFDDFSISITSYPPLIANAGQDISINCPGDPVSFLPSASGGSSGYSFSWTDWADTKDTLNGNPTVTTNYVVQVTDNCPTDTVSDTVTVFVPAYLPLLPVTEGIINACPFDEVNLTVNATGGEGTYSYAWSNSAGTDDSVSVFPPNSTTYTVTVTDLCGNINTATVEISMVVPNADFEFDLREDNTVFFTNTSQLADTFFWDFGDGETSSLKNPVYNYKFVDEYDVILYVTTQYGCTDSVVKRIIPRMQIWVPNAFTPNGDEINDVFQVSGIGIKNFSIMIFDRWGELVFQSDNINNSWDGKNAKGKLWKNDTYVWRIKASGLKYEKFEKKGRVTLVK